MIIKEYRKIKLIINKALKELEKKAIENGTIVSDDYEEGVLELKRIIVEKAGFSFDDYLELEEMDKGLDKIEVNKSLKELKKNYKEIPTKNDIYNIAKKAVKDNKQPPKIINKVVKEIIIKQPQIIEKTKIDKKALISLEKDLTYLQENFLEYIEKSGAEINKVKKQVSNNVLNKDVSMEKKENLLRWKQTNDKIALIRQTISRMTWGLDENIKKVNANLSNLILEIDLSSQLDGSETEFSLGRVVKGIITLSFSPDNGEELKVITII